MRVKHGLFVLVLLVGVLVAPAPAHGTNGDMVTLVVEGQVQGLPTSLLPWIEDYFTWDDPIRLEYTFDLTTPDSNPDLGGHYENAIKSVELTIGSLSGSGPSLRIVTLADSTAVMMVVKAGSRPAATSG